ncbi:MAG: hypothetical protein N3F09_02180 [Bacteroidia bacterium]|nr:hypothetical protein [Bacteroidia bacterium]
MIFFSCVKDKPVVIKENADFFTGESGKVFVLNEGNFGSGNGSVTLYEPVSGAITEDIYYQQNQQIAGDVVQSMEKINGFYFLVVNNSGKIVCLNKGFKIQNVLSGLVSPRYILQTAPDRALVSDLYANKIILINPNNMQIVQQIPFGGWAERMIKYQDKVFITNMKKNYLFVMNIPQYQITDSILIHKGSSSLAIDRYNKLWVLCNGDIMQNIPGGLFKINLQTLQVEWSTIFTSGHPSHLCINVTSDTLMFLHNNGIWRMPVTSSVTPSNEWIHQGNKNFYAMGVNPSSGNIYVADAKDYIQKSDIYIYRPNGSLLGTFKAGIISGNFFFD